jgi:hypothetical protein
LRRVSCAHGVATGVSRAHGGESYSRGRLNRILVGGGESHSMLTSHRIVLCIAGVGLCLARYPSLRLFTLPHLDRGIPAGQVMISIAF